MEHWVGGWGDFQCRRHSSKDIVLSCFLRQNDCRSKVNNLQSASDCVFWFGLQELDEASLANLIKDTNVLQTKEYLEWNWGLLFSFLQHPSLRTTHISEDALFSRYEDSGADRTVAFIIEVFLLRQIKKYNNMYWYLDCWA